jgi:hypothetical protein
MARLKPCPFKPGLDVAADGAAFLQIFLVVFFGAPEGFRWDDLGHDGLRELLLGCEAGDGGPGSGFLLWGVEEDGAAILRAPVGTLAVELGGVVELEESIEQLFVRDLISTASA